MKVIFKDNIKSYLLIFLLSIIAGLSVVFFCEFPNNDICGHFLIGVQILLDFGCLALY